MSIYTRVKSIENKKQNMVLLTKILYLRDMIRKDLYALYKPIYNVILICHSKKNGNFINYFFWVLSFESLKEFNRGFDTQ